MDTLQLLFSSLSFMEENLMYDLHARHPENQLRKHQVTCGPSVLAQEGSLQDPRHLCSRHATFALLWGGYSTVLIPWVDPPAISAVHPLSQHPTDGAGRSEAPQPAARKQISYHPHDPCHPTPWKKTNMSKLMAVVSNLKLVFKNSYMREHMLFLSAAYLQNQNSL